MFYTYYQNNSGGILYEDENVGQYVVIEGDTIEDINERAEKIFENYMEFCPCCGERWKDLDCENKNELEDSPSILSCTDSFWAGRGESIVVYYKDGRKEFHKHKR